MRMRLPEYKGASQRDIDRVDALMPSTWLESVGANMGAAWDWSPVARVGEALGERLAEVKAYGGSNQYENALAAQKEAISKEDWPQHEYYREGMEWEEGLTPVAAKYRAEFYDARRSRDAILAKQTTMQKVMGFGVQMGVGLVDPVNFIPIIGPATKAKAIAGMGSIAGRMLVSGAEAGIGNLGANLLVGPELKRRGENINFEDYAWDTFIGSGVGMLFGGVGGAWAKHFKGETKEAVLRGLQQATLDVSDGKSVDVGPILKDVVESGQFNRERASQRLFDSGLDAGQAETFLRHWDGLAAAQGLDTDSWVKKHIADIEVGGDDGPGIRFAKKVLYDDTGKIKVEYEDTGTEFSLTDRQILKEYFESLNPERIKSLKYTDPNNYIDVLKDISEHLFPEGVELKKTKDGTRPYYEYFLKQEKRAEYIHTFPDTLKNMDVKIILNSSENVKEVFLKRYFDEDLEKDVWDAVFLFNRNAQTKVPTKGGDGRREMGRIVTKEKNDFDRAEFEASQSTNPGGDTGTAPTRQDTSTIIDHVNRESKPLAADIRHTVEGLQSRAKNTLPLKVVDTFAELPEHVKARYRERHMVGGVRGVNDGRSVYIVADAFDSVDQAVAIWMHEQGVHHGLRGLVGDDAKFDSLMDSVFDHFGAENLEDIRQAYRLDFDNVAHRREAAEEMLAHLGEKMARGDELNHMERSMWDQIKTWFAKFLRERGINVALTDEDIAGIVKDAVRWTLDGTPGVSRRGPQRFSVDGRANGSVEFLPDGRAHVRLFDGADLDQAGEALSRILSERFNEFPPAERLDWRTERPERDLPDPMDDMEPDEAFARDMDEVQVLAEAGKLTEAELGELRSTDRGVEQSGRISEAFRVAAECIIKGGM
jgi:hypothetical protein